MPMRRLLVVVVLVAAVRAQAELSPEDVAAIQRDQAKATQAVEDKYPGKRSAADLRALSKEKAAAERAVLEARGVKPGEWARAAATLSADERAAVEATKKALDQQEERAAKGASKPAKAPAVDKSGANEAAELDKKLGLGPGAK